MKKLTLILLIFSTIQLSCYSNIQIEDLKEPQEHAYRIGTTDNPEIKYNFDVQPTVQPIVQKEVTVKDSQNLTYADLSIKKMALEISKNIDVEYNEMLADLSLLWQGAAMRSDTIKFAIYKLSNPDKDKPDNNAVKKVLTTIAGMSTLVGAGMGNPVMASAALVGGNTLGIMSTDTKALNYKYTQVTDADMIILVRKVEELQQKVVDMYYDYLTARELYNMSTQMVARSYENYKASQTQPKPVILMTDTFYRESLDEQQKARGNFFEKRSRLEQLVGNDVFRDFENMIDKREAKSN